MFHLKQNKKYTYIRNQCLATISPDPLEKHLLVCSLYWCLCHISVSVEIASYRLMTLQIKQLGKYECSYPKRLDPIDVCSTLLTLLPFTQSLMSGAIAIICAIYFLSNTVIIARRFVFHIIIYVHTH